MKDMKHDHMAMISIVAIVAIVGLFLMFSNNGSSTSTDEDLSGQAYVYKTYEGPGGFTEPIYIWTWDEESEGQEALLNSMKELSDEEITTIQESGICFIDVNNQITFCYEDLCKQVRSCPSGATQAQIPGGITLDNIITPWDCMSDPDCWNEG